MESGPKQLSALYWREWRDMKTGLHPSAICLRPTGSLVTLSLLALTQQ